MATRKKFSQLDEISSLTIDDIFAVSDDPAGTPISKKASLQKLVDLLEKGYFARQVENVSNLSSESAASGYVCIVRDLDRGGIFKAVNGGTVNNGTIFSSATIGWTWQRLFSGPVNIKWFGCVGDDSTSNDSTLQSASDYALANDFSLYVPEGTYKVTDFINFYDLLIYGDGRERSIIKSYATAKPIGVFNGSHGQVKSVSFNYDSQKTDPNCANMLFTGYSGAGTGGWYWGTINDVGMRNGDTPMHTTGTISTTLSSSALSGATSIQVATLSTGGFQEIVAGCYITVTLDSGSQVVQVDSISGTTLALKTALTGAATSGNAVSAYESVWFSNSIDNIYIRSWNRYAFLHRGSGTGSVINNLYCANGDADTYPNCVGVLYLSGKNDITLGQINSEWMTITGAACIYAFGGDSLDSASWHFEGVKFGGTSQALFSTTQKSFEAKAVTIDGWDVPNSVGAFGFVRLEASSTDYSPVMELKGVSVTNSRFETPVNFYYGIDLNSNKSRLLISNLSLNKDSGCKVRGQLMSPSTSSPTLKRLTPFFDETILAYTFKASVGSIADVTIFSRSKKISPQTLSIGNCTSSLTTAVAQVRDATGGGGNTLFASSALSAITGPTTYFKANNDAGIDNTILDLTSDGKLYLRVTTAQSSTAVSGTSVSVSRTNSKADGGTGISRINWSTNPNLEVGDVITTSGFTDTSFNGTFVVSESGSNYIEFYKYTGTSKSTTADVGGSISKVAAVDLLIKGVDWGRELI